MIQVDVLIPSLGRHSLHEARTSAQRALLASDEVELILHVIEDSDRRGPAWARNQAAKQGSATFLALLDDDDLWLTGRLTGALEVLQTRPEVAVVCGEALPREGGLFLAGDPRGTGRPVTIAPGDHTHRELAADCFVAASSVTLRRADWEQANGMPEHLPQAEDYALWLTLTRGGRPVHVLPDALCRLRAGDSAGSSDDAGEAARCTLAALREFAAPDAVMDARVGTLLATQALHARRSGRRAEARSLALEALQRRPAAALTWKAALRALL
jgi:hypothetical protein